MLNPNGYDCHTHTYFSFDALENSSSPGQMASAAARAGLKGIILTDHLEVNSEVEGLYAKFEFEKRQDACFAVKENFKDKLDIMVGIELGQPTQYPELAAEYLQKYNYEFVIGSLHNLRGEPDFALMDFSGFAEKDYTALWERYLKELYELTLFGGIDCFAHLTYPLRYFSRHGYSLDTGAYSVQLSQILKSIIARGAFLEVNSSGFRQGMGCPMPNAHIIRLYKKLGGERAMITLGSDAHFPKDVGADFDKTARLIDETYKEQ